MQRENNNYVNSNISNINNNNDSKKEDEIFEGQLFQTRLGTVSPIQVQLRTKMKHRKQLLTFQILFSISFCLGVLQPTSNSANNGPRSFVKSSAVRGQNEKLTNSVYQVNRIQKIFTQIDQFVLFYMSVVDMG